MKLVLVSLLAVFALALPARAIVITNPLSLQTQFLAGIVNGQPGDSSIASEATLAQTILNLALGEVSDPFAANTLFDYSGTITTDGGQQSGTSIPSGWNYALAKYDGNNAGYVLFVLNGQASTIPQFPALLWTDNPEQYAISHYTLFSPAGGPPPPPPPPPPPVPDGGTTLSLLGLALMGIGSLRLKLAAGRCAP